MDNRKENTNFYHCWIPEDFEAKSNFGERNLALLRSGKFSDFNITCEDKTFKVHKFILSSASDIFLTMLSMNPGMKEIDSNTLNIVDFEVTIVERFLEYLYMEEMTVDYDAATLLALAHKYQVKDLCFICEKKLVGEINLENVLDTLQILGLYSDKNDDHLQNAFNFAGENLMELIKLPNWRKFRKSTPDIVDFITIKHSKWQSAKLSELQKKIQSNKNEHSAKLLELKKIIRSNKNKISMKQLKLQEALSPSNIAQCLEVLEKIHEQMKVCFVYKTYSYCKYECDQSCCHNKLVIDNRKKFGTKTISEIISEHFDTLQQEIQTYE